MTSKPANQGYAELVRSLAGASRRHRQVGYLALAVALIAVGAWAFATGQNLLLRIALAAALVADVAWIVIQRVRHRRAVVDRFVEHPDQVTTIEQIHRSRAVFLRLHLGTGERVDLKVPARQAAAIGHRLQSHCRLASIHIR